MFEENVDIITKFLQENIFDEYYVRDPFNAEVEQIHEKLEKIFEIIPKEKFLDNTFGISDVFFEDKWLQYQDFQDFIPETKILEKISDIDNPDYITKKRISSRAKGILFSSDKFQKDDKLEDYIWQKKYNILKEYRIYIVNWEIIKQASIKSSKTANSSVKIIDNITISEKLENFIKNFKNKIPYGLVGLDIAECENNEFKLIEINRSPQFVAYHRETSINIAEKFLKI